MFLPGGLRGFVRTDSKGDFIRGFFGLVGASYGSVGVQAV